MIIQDCNSIRFETECFFGNCKEDPEYKVEYYHYKAKGAYPFTKLEIIEDKTGIAFFCRKHYSKVMKAFNFKSGVKIR